MLSIIQKIQDEFTVELQQIIKKIDSDLDLAEPLLYDVSSYMLKSSGKHIRPLLIILWHKLLQPKDSSYIAIAAAVEMVHLATLLHDDVLDEGKLRRFQHTVNVVWGNKVAILAGDFLLCQALKLLSSIDSLPAIQELVNSSAAMVTGEIKQLLNLNKFIDEQTYLQIIDHKTAKLFAAASVIAGLGMKQPQTIITKMQDFGKKLGRVFQITDDLADYYPLTEFGKKNGNDFHEGKITLPIILLAKSCNVQEAQYLKQLFSSPKIARVSEEIPGILALFTKYQIPEQIDIRIQQLKLNLNAILDTFALADFSSSALDNLRLLVEYVTSRAYITKTMLHE